MCAQNVDKNREQEAEQPKCAFSLQINQAKWTHKECMGGIQDLGDIKTL